MGQILIALRGGPGLLLLVFVTLSYLYLALTPFDWDPPRWVENGARFDGSGVLAISSPGTLESDRPHSLLVRAIRQNEFRLSLRFRAARPVQSGPARIFTVSADPHFRNVTVAQEEHDLVVRLRTPETTNNGLPAYLVPGVFLSDSWHVLELEIEGRNFQLTIDGLVVESDTLPERPLQNWNPRYRIALGNELTRNRPWLGKVSEAEISVEERQIDLLRSKAIQLPERFWTGGGNWQLMHPRSILRLYGSPTDLLYNFLGFVPAGFLLVILWSRPRIALTVSVIAIVSLSVEFTQAFLIGRHPSALDWMTNVAGGGVGAWLAAQLYYHHLIEDLEDDARRPAELR